MARGTLLRPSARPWKSVLGPLTLPGNSAARQRPGSPRTQSPSPGAAGRRRQEGRAGAGAAGGARTSLAAAAAEPSGRRSWLTRSLPGFRSHPCTHYFPLSVPFLGSGEPYPMCFLLNARVSCLQYSSHMVAGGQALPGSPSPVWALPREPADSLSRWPFLSLSRVGSPYPGLQRSMVASTT